MTQTEALKLALDFVEDVYLGEWRGPTERQEEAITAIKEALAQPEQPKVRTGDCLLVGVCASEGHKIQKAQPEQRSVSEHLEPVAWMDKDGERVVSAVQKAGMHKSLQASFPIALGYTTPPQRTWVGLTDEEVRDVYQNYMENPDDTWDYERAIEAKLKEKNGV